MPARWAFFGLVQAAARWAFFGLVQAAARVPDRRSPSRIAFGARCAAAFGRP
jgi:hypothetical protein